MKIEYSKEADALYMKFNDKEIADTDEISEDMILDYDENGNVIAIEILNASKKGNMKKIIIEAFNKSVLVDGHEKCEISL